MKLERTKAHPLCIFNHFFKDFGALIFAAVMLFVLRSEDAMIEFWFIFIPFIIAPIGRVKGYLTTFYSLDDVKLTVEMGLFVKNRIEVPLANILNIDMAQPLLYQIFDVVELRIENANAAAVENQLENLSMVFKKDQAVEIRNLMLKRENVIEKADAQFQQENGRYDNLPVKAADFTEVFLLGLLKIEGITIINIAIIFLMIVPYAEELFNTFNINMGVSTIGTVIAVGILLAVVASLVITSVKYIDFTIKDRGNSLFVQYGLLNKKTHTILKEKVSGVAFKQPPFMRIFGIGYVEIYAIGYGTVNVQEDTAEISMMYPLVKKDEFKEFVKEFLPEFYMETEPMKAEKKSLPYFFAKFTILIPIAISTISILLSIFTETFPEFNTVGCGILICIGMFPIITALLEYKNTAVGLSDKEILLCNGTLTRSEVHIRKVNIEYVEESASKFKQKRNLTNLEVGFLAPMGESMESVRNIPADTAEKIKDSLDF